MDSAELAKCILILYNQCDKPTKLNALMFILDNLDRDKLLSVKDYLTEIA